MKEDRLENPQNQWKTCEGLYKTTNNKEYDLINYKDHGCILHTLSGSWGRGART
jgi:hypothetical protein